MMHIAFLTSEYPHPRVKSAAGIGTSIKNLAEALVKKNIRVTLFIYGQSKNEVFEQYGIKFHLIEDRDFNFAKWFYYRRMINKYINQVVVSEKISIIEAADWTGITATMRFTIPLVIRLHGSDTYFCHLEQRKQKWKNYYYEKIAIKSADAFIAPTKFAGELSAKLFNISKGKIEVIYHGLDANKFQNSKPNNFKDQVILYIGSIVRKKGVLELPAIFKLVQMQNPNAKLVLIGADCPDLLSGQKSTWKLIQNICETEDLNNVQYLGKVSYEEVQQHIINAHLCVFPTFAETFGMVTIESMALQKAVVNSNVGWANELMEDGRSGFLVDPKDHKSFADKISEILNNDGLATSMGKNARQYVLENFDIEKKVDENIMFYKKLLK